MIVSENSGETFAVSDAREPFPNCKGTVVLIGALPDKVAIKALDEKYGRRKINGVDKDMEEVNVEMMVVVVMKLALAVVTFVGVDEIVLVVEESGLLEAVMVGWVVVKSDEVDVVKGVNDLKGLDCSFCLLLLLSLLFC